MRIATNIVSGLALAGCQQIFDLQAPRGLDARVEGDGIDASIDGPKMIKDAIFMDAPDAPPAATDCPATYTVTRTGSTSLYRFTAATSWLSAAQQCAADSVSGSTKHTHLAVIGDETERVFLVGFDTINNNIFWLGISDRQTEGSFIGVTQENTGGYPPPAGNPPWGLSQPTGGVTEDCVATLATAKFQDADCAASMPAMCECDDFANDPTRY